jgi:hypothetical protein
MVFEPGSASTYIAYDRGSEIPDEPREITSNGSHDMGVAKQGAMT